MGMQLSRAVGLFTPLLVAGLACTTSRAIDLSAGPDTIGHYLDARHPTDVQVTDSAGRKAWLHSPRVEGDSLVGVLSRDEPRERLAIPLASIRSLAVPHFSAGRTAGLIGGTVGAAGLIVIIIASSLPDAVY
ncbi:MAG: hypothetical protein ABI587_01860 [Gemmatimonadales bacterium]